LTFNNLHLEFQDHVAIITIDHPPANTLSTATLSELKEALNLIESNDQIKAVVLTGNGKMFIAGADIKEIGKIDSFEEGERLAKAGQQLFNEIENLKIPVIAAVNGPCLGGGMELAMACHIRIASETAKFGQPEINLGIIPGFGGTQRLPRLTNKAVALEWILTGDLYSALDAYQVGLVNQVVKAESLMDEALSMAQKIASKSKVAIGKAMVAVNQGLDNSLQDGLVIEANQFAEACITEDKQEGVKAFFEKRKPIFVDR